MTNDNNKSNQNNEKKLVEKKTKKLSLKPKIFLSQKLHKKCYNFENILKL